MTDNLRLAQQFAWSLAKTLMTPVILFRWECGFGAIPSAEYEGPADAILTEYDPFAR